MRQTSVRSLNADIKRVQGPTLTILVGPSKEPFHIHESIICNSSLFFQKAMSGSWKESKERTLELPEDDPERFALYSHWLYFAKLPVIAEGETKEESAKNRRKEYRDLTYAYVLGDRLLDSKFQNSVIDAIVEKYSTKDTFDGKRYTPGTDMINHAYKLTTESATIRKLLVDIYADTATVSWFSRELTKGFLYSVVESLIKKRAPSSKSIKASNYYVRPSGN
ncbi:unnamed protein product [Penicillium glandicola]